MLAQLSLELESRIILYITHIEYIFFYRFPFNKNQKTKKKEVISGINYRHPKE